MEELKTGFDYYKSDENSPNWAFFHITKELDLYYGNAGAHTKYLGNPKTDPATELCSEIADLKANYDYYAYYNIEQMLPAQVLIEKLQPLHTNFVYQDIAGCLYSWNDLCGVPNIII
jgi:hypothetical protein